MEAARDPSTQRSPFSPAQHDRQSAVSGISRFWRSNPAPPSSTTPSNRSAGRTFEVPLFLSTSRSSARNNLFARSDLPTGTRSRDSTHSAIDNAIPLRPIVRTLPAPQRDQDEASDMYAAPSVGSQTVVEEEEPIEHIPVIRNLDDPQVPSDRQSTRSHRSGSYGTHSSNSSRGTRSSSSSGRRHGGFSRMSIRDPRIRSKAILSFTFGVTFLVALVIYFVLTGTGVAKDTMFHVVSLLLLLGLAGVFFHQIIRMVMIIQGRRRRRPHHRTTARARHRHARSRPRQPESPKPRDEPDEDVPTETPIEILMASDTGFGPDVEDTGDLQTIQVPPPVYGNTRTSRRMNPDLVHWKEVASTNSPLTPTYDEALIQVRRTVGFRPPSYPASDGGLSELIERQTSEVDAALESIHPLERERMRNLAADALEGRGQPGQL